jgi:hypothetical protein
VAHSSKFHTACTTKGQERSPTLIQSPSHSSKSSFCWRNFGWLSICGVRRHRFITKGRYEHETHLSYLLVEVPGYRIWSRHWARLLRASKIQSHLFEKIEDRIVQVFETCHRYKDIASNFTKRIKMSSLKCRQDMVRSSRGLVIKPPEKWRSRGSFRLYAARAPA